MTALLAFGSLIPAMGQRDGKGTGKVVEGQRHYDIIVTQANDTLAFNRGLRAIRGNGAQLSNRGIVSDILGGYLTLGTSTLMSASQNLIGAGLSMIQEAARDKRPDWQKATQGECRFVKHLPMQTEILDFYGAPSTIGALDPTGIQFSGFGCRQYITIKDQNGEPREEEVFYLSCSLRDDPYGLSRMLNHSKFEVVVDELRFNPYLCNLPNDSLSVDPSTRIGFDFDKRRDLQFKVVATISSSWINEAIQVTNDQPLGQFVITAKIDPKQMDGNVFRYKRGEDEEGKVVVVTGDSFLVPRSYVGFTSLDEPVDTWGTGQYKVEMDISETCQINEAYYTETVNGKKRWKKDAWKEEWKMMGKRPKRGGGTNFVDLLFPSFSGKKWITTIIEPTTTVLLKQEGEFVNAAATNLATKVAGGEAPAAAGGASGAAGSKSGGASGGKPGK